MMKTFFTIYKPGFKKGLLILIGLAVFGLVAAPFMSRIGAMLYGFFFVLVVALSVFEIIFFNIPQLIGGRVAAFKTGGNKNKGK